MLLPLWSERSLNGDDMLLEHLDMVPHFLHLAFHAINILSQHAIFLLQLIRFTIINR
jgi:hypothetical protein